MKHKHQGSCLCGEVRFEVDGEFEAFYLCHCEYCRKDTGSAHASNLFSFGAALTWSKGEGAIRSYTLPQTRHTKSFCSLCGSALPHTQMNGKLIVVPAGSLDSSIAIKPNAHIFTASRAGWDSGLESVPTVERMPT